MCVAYRGRGHLRTGKSTMNVNDSLSPSEHGEISANLSDAPLQNPSEQRDAFWYAAHVRSRHEKLVAEELSAKSISHYLPLIEKRKQWSDRRMLVKEPVFPGYLFVNISLDVRADVLETRGVVQLVGSNGKLWPVPDDEIEAIRMALNGGLKCDPYPYLKVGNEVYVTRGSLKGYHGVLIEKNKKHRLVLSIHLIGQALSVEIDAADVKPL